ncbi:hemocyanin A chain-like [Oratosquilla oratoria]|uniref:hemocyanin A chain-like n=1 Tax=Oratosquilla oratoria TaxID=337810 RepID=UPI003F774EA7
MKLSAVVLCGLLAAVSAASVDSDTPLNKRQQDVNRLLFKPTEPILDEYEKLKEVSKSFDPVLSKNIYNDDGKAAKLLMDEWLENRLTPKKHWFSLFNEAQRSEAISFFELLMSCKTWKCFSYNAAFFRERINEGVFVYGLYVAVTHSSLATGVVLPPLYEITPHMFTNSEVIQRAYTAKMTQRPGRFRMDFTGSKRNPEQRVAYFGEDIGLNSHHVSWHMSYPFWWKNTYGHKLDRKGELFFWAHHQLTVRFDAERLSNHLAPVDELYWTHPIVEGFAPHTIYKYGGEFPARPANVIFENVDGVATIPDMLTYERRIREAVDHGYMRAVDGSIIKIADERGIDYLGDIIESSEYSKNPEYYGALHNLAHIILGRQADPHGKYNMPPGVMEHFETATRDPAFFRLHKYMDGIFKKHKDSLPPYTTKDLVFEGIAIEKLAIKGALETYFEPFQFNLEMAVDSAPQVKEVPLSAYTSRLNHLPFSYDIVVVNNNDKELLATFRIFLCPAEDNNEIPYTLDEARWHCIEMDKFWKNLAAGVNSIERKSSDSSVTVPDRPSFRNIMAITDAAVASGTTPQLSSFVRSCGIPERLLLPKGNTEGTEFKLLLVITDGEQDAVLDNLHHETEENAHTTCGIHGEKFPDKRPMGFPLDRQIPDVRVFQKLTNIKQENVTIIHNPNIYPARPL